MATYMSFCVNIFKIFGIMVFSLALYGQNVSIANNTLKDSIAKLMNINQKDIKLKKQKFGMNSSQIIFSKSIIKNTF